jgi:2-keto-4-pentenoate hydratase/2-oxohepta-3-ene-1,7-dioic acid hydratase in catechol pathway
MHIASVETAAGTRLAVRQGDEHFLVEDPEGGDLRSVLVAGVDVGALPVASDPLTSPVIRAPLAPGKIVAIGLNYRDHVREAGMDLPAAPLIFTKFPNAVIATGDAIVFDPALARRVDWEVELAVVIGRLARNVSESRALDHVFGYTVANDVSARDLQFGDGQWVRGKSLDTFCPLGPVVATPDEIGDPQALRLRTRVNGETVQDSTTAEMVFGVAELISYCSRNFTLEPGDVLLTGTPWGCGEFMDPQRHLHDADVVECEIERIGALVNPIHELSLEA